MRTSHHRRRRVMKMVKSRRISPAERRHVDYLRKRGLKTGAVYQTRLVKLRRKEVRRLLDMCRDYDVSMWDEVIREGVDERYLFGWFRGLWQDAGLPKAQSTARDMSRGKASPEDDYWLGELARYAEQRAGSEIVLLERTMRDNLVSIVRTVMSENVGVGVEKVAKQIYEAYKGVELWQARRIAQTETMIGLADAGAMAARTLGVDFTKQWCTSGLANTRDSHLLMDGVEVDGNEPFSLPDCMMMWPHDTSMGAPAGEIINCACDVIRRPK